MQSQGNRGETLTRKCKDCGVCLVVGSTWTDCNKNRNYYRCSACHRILNAAQMRQANAAKRGIVLPAVVIKPIDHTLEERRIRIASNASINRIKTKGIVKEMVVDGSVYVITNAEIPGRVKIGWGADPEARLGDYKTYHPTPYVQYGYAHAPSIAAEKEVHSFFEPFRVAGTKEWFWLTPEAALDIVKKICLEHSTNGGLSNANKDQSLSDPTGAGDAEADWQSVADPLDQADNLFHTLYEY